MNAGVLRRWMMLMNLAGVLAAVWIFYGLAHRASRGGEQAPLYSTFRCDPYGTAALAELLRRRGVDARVLDCSAPDARHSGLLIQVLRADAGDDEPTEATVAHLEPQALRDWIAAGNTVLQLGAPSGPLTRDAPMVPVSWHQQQWTRLEQRMLRGCFPEQLDWREQQAQWIADPQDIVPGLRTPLPPLVLHSPAPLALAARGESALRPEARYFAPDRGSETEANPGRFGEVRERRAGAKGPLLGPNDFCHGLLGPKSQWQALADCADVGVVMAQRRIGSGRLIVISSPTPALNGALGLGGNLDLILGLAGSGAVWFDDWSHGIGQGGSILAVIARLGLGPMLAQGVLVLLLSIWSTRGWSHAEPAPAVRRRSCVEQVQALGHLYTQALGPAEIWRRTQLEVARRMAQVLGCAPMHITRRVNALPEALGQRARALQQAVFRQAPGATTGLCLNCGHELENLADRPCPGCGAPPSAAAPEPLIEELAPRCQACEYPLAGNTTGVCPECGTKVSPFEAQAQRVRLSAALRADRRRRREVETAAAHLLTESSAFVLELSREHHPSGGTGHGPKAGL